MNRVLESDESLSELPPPVFPAARDISDFAMPPYAEQFAELGTGRNLPGFPIYRALFMLFPPAEDEMIERECARACCGKAQ
jgi:hypothetical protein